MVKIYVRKITSTENNINPNTGKPWCLEDVPPRWRDEVAAELAKLQG